MKRFRQAVAIFIMLSYMVSCGAVYSSDRLDIGDKLLFDLPLFVVAALLAGMVLPREEEEHR